MPCCTRFGEGGREIAPTPCVELAELSRNFPAFWLLRYGFDQLS